MPHNSSYGFNPSRTRPSRPSKRGGGLLARMKSRISKRKGIGQLKPSPPRFGDPTPTPARTAQVSALNGKTKAGASRTSPTISRYKGATPPSSSGQDKARQFSSDRFTKRKV